MLDVTETYDQLVIRKRAEWRRTIDATWATYGEDLTRGLLRLFCFMAWSV